MAKRKKGTQGGGSIDDQIATLEAEVKPKGCRAAAEIVENYDAAIIKLAFKRIRKIERQSGVGGLGSRIETLLETMPAKEASAMRQSLLTAKRKSKGE